MESKNMSKYSDLLDKLIDYSNKDKVIPMHMPGTKRNSNAIDGLFMGNPYDIDITEIDGFDNLHNADGIIRDAQKRAAKLYGADETYFLVNGSTAGILSAVCGATKKGDNILVARNCHVSVYNAILLRELNPYYIIPESDKATGIYYGIKLADVKSAIGNNEKNISSVIITSPTYEGYISEIKEIADFLHSMGISLIVDEAHGAHFNFSDAFPESAVNAGADVVINSIHKTLPALTQTALLHINKGLVDVERIKRYWNIYQSTSPSYVLMASMDRCMSIIERNGKELFDNYVSNIMSLRKQLNSSLKNIKLLDTDDISKIILVCNNGKKLMDLLLKKYNIQLEMASFKYVIAMTSIADDVEYYKAFAKAVIEADQELSGIDADNVETFMINSEFDVAKSPANALIEQDNYGYEDYSINSSDIYGKISLSSILLYPPGMPVVNIGERINKDVIDIIIKAKNAGLEVPGLIGEGKIRCLR